MSQTAPKAGNLPVTLASFIFLLHDRGHSPKSAALQMACKSLADASEDQADDHGGALVDAVTAELDTAEDDFETVLGFVEGLYGEGAISTAMGSNREECIHTARSYEFQKSLPWIARIIDRFPDGTVGAHWVLVERFTDSVTCMDPYPWDDLDEEYNAPVTDFMVKWELAGGQSLRWVG